MSQPFIGQQLLKMAESVIVTDTKEYGYPKIEIFEVVIELKKIA